MDILMYVGLNSNLDDTESTVEKIRSHVGMIIHSTTLDTMQKVINIYGGTTWVKIEGRMLLGQSSSYAINSTGGSVTNTLSVANLPSHNHGMNNHTHSIPALSGTAANATLTGTAAFSDNIVLQSNGAPYVKRTSGILSMSSEPGTQSLYGNVDYGTFASDRVLNINATHSHTVTTTANTTGKATGNTANSGSGTAVNNMPPYKTVYIWERTA